MSPFQFIAQAEEKISQCITIPIDPEPQIEKICGPGVDPTFDQLISALGHIASQKPKPLIDSMMLWRKNKSDAASEARIQLQQVGETRRPSFSHAHKCDSLEAMLYLDNLCGGTRSHLICWQTRMAWLLDSSQQPHVKKLLPKPNVGRPLRSIYYAES